jgi:hypothetical protein
MPETHVDADQSWHLDKRVPIALIAGMCIQFCSIVWWVSQMTQRVDNLEAANSNITDVQTRLIRVEVQLTGLDVTMNRIDRRVEKLDDSRRNRP